MTELRKELEAILLSDEFISKLAAAISNAEMPSRIIPLTPEEVMSQDVIVAIDPRYTWEPIVTSSMSKSIANQIEHGESETR